MPVKFNRKNIILLSIPTILVIIIVATLFWFFDRMKQAGNMRIQASATLISSQQILVALIDAESGTRGFLMLDDESYLAPYQYARDRLPVKITQLRETTLDADAKAQLDKVEPLVREKIKRLMSAISLRRGSNLAEVLATVPTNNGKKIMDDLRTELEKYNKLQQARVDYYHKEYLTNMNYLFAFIVSASIFMLLFAQVFAYGIYRNIHERLKNFVHEQTKRSLDQQEAMNQQLNMAYLTVQDSERKLEVTLNSIADAVIATDREARITLINHVAELLTGWTQDEAIGRPIPEIFKIINKDTRQPMTVPVIETLLYGTAQGSNDTVLILRDGNHCTVANSCSPIRDHDGQVIGAVLVFRDITAENAAQQALLDSNELVNTILSTVADGIVTFHVKTNLIETVNPAAEKMFGYDTTELIGQRFSTLIPELNEDNGLLAYYNPSETERTNGVVREVTGRLKNGQTLPMEMAVSEMRLGGQRYFTGVLRNISARKQAELKLRENERHLRAVIDALPVAIYTTDAHGCLTHFNESAVEFSGRTPALGTDHWCISMKLYNPDGSDLPHEQCPMAIALKEKRQILGAEAIAERPDGTQVWFTAHPTPLYDTDGELIGGINMLIDITERKRLDQVLMENNTELKRSKYLAEKANRAKSDFLSNMSHELRTPLSAILGFAQLLDASNPPPTPKQKRSVDQILQAGWYLLDLINEILDLTLIESGRLPVSMEVVSVPELIRECETMIEPQALTRNISLHFPALSSSVFVKADITRLKQALINILSNAIKYNRQNGSVTVTCTKCAANRLRISIADTGEGLSPNELTQLFQPFNRLGKEDSSIEGTGIGLVMTKRLVKLMGGRIHVKSTVGQGTIFSIDLDIASPDAIEIDPTTPHHTPPISLYANAHLPKRTILYIEDNPANLTLIEEVVASRTELVLLSERDAYRGIERARIAQPDLILMDINLPGMSGTDALSVLAKDPLTKHITVIALSANAIPNDIEKGLEAGFFRYLTKPVKINEFINALDSAFEFSHKDINTSNKETTP